MSAAQNAHPSLTLGKHLVKRLDERRMILVDGRAITWTPAEYRLLLRLLEGQPVSDNELIAALFNDQTDIDFWARETLSRHLENMRRKLRKRRVPLSIRRISSFGYLLLPDLPLRKR